MIQQERVVEFQRVRDEIGERIKRFSETGVNKGKSQSSIVLEIDSFIYISFTYHFALKPLLKIIQNIM